jgi:hypothetical protein
MRRATPVVIVWPDVESFGFTRLVVYEQYNLNLFEWKLAPLSPP